MNRSYVYHTEDINSLTANVPTNLKTSVTKLTYDMINHEAYDNKR